MRILHTADIHPRDKDVEELDKCLSFMVLAAQSEKVDLSIIAGDTFSLEATNKIDSPAFKLIISAVSALADIGPVFIIEGTPSHDGAAPEILQYVKGKYPIHVTTKPEQVYVKQHDVVLTLIPTFTKQYFQGTDQEIAQAMNAVFAGFGAQASEYDAPHVLVGHWNVAGSKLSTGQTLTGKDVDIPYDAMMLANPDLICLGHIHLPQQIGDRAFYPGSLYPLTWGELEAKGFYIHELDGKKLVESKFIETPIRKLIRVAENHAREEGIEEFGYALYSFSNEDLKDAFVRADITVWQDEAAKIDKEQIKQFYLSGGAIDADIRIIRVPRQTVRSESVLKVNSLRDKISALAELRDETVPESVLLKADLLEFGEEKEQVAA